MLVKAFIAIALASQAVGAALLPRASSVPPSQDPFYFPPAGFESLANGAIIRNRPVPNPIANILGKNLTADNVKAAYQILYRTTDTLGNATAAVSTLIVPKNAQPGKLLSYQTAYDQADVNCSPSYVLQTQNNKSSTLEVAFLSIGLQKGWYISTADYEGPKAGLAAGVGTGRSVLDSVRAALSSNSFSGLQSNANFTMWGYSGGALATEWATELQPAYASDLSSRFLGAAMGGPPVNITNDLFQVNGGDNAFLIPTLIEGLAHAYPNLSSYLNTHLVPSKRAEFEKVLNCNNNDIMSTFAGKDIFAYFTSGRATLQDPVVRSVLTYGATMGLHGTPRAPMYLYQGQKDQVVVPADTDALRDAYCARGVRVRLIRDTATEHAGEAVLGAAGAVGWLRERFDGTPVPAGCPAPENVAFTRLQPDALAEFGQEIYGILENILPLPVGPKLGWSPDSASSSS